MCRACSRGEMLLKYFLRVESLVALTLTQAVPVSLHQVRLSTVTRQLDDMHGLRQAAEAIDSGRAAAQLEQLVALSNEAE